MFLTDEIFLTENHLWSNKAKEGTKSIVKAIGQKLKTGCSLLHIAFIIVTNKLDKIDCYVLWWSSGLRFCMNFFFVLFSKEQCQIYLSVRKSIWQPLYWGSQNLLDSVVRQITATLAHSLAEWSHNVMFHGAGFSAFQYLHCMTAGAGCCQLSVSQLLQYWVFMIIRSVAFSLGRLLSGVKMKL